MIRISGLAALAIAAAMSFLTASPAAAQGTMNPIKKPAGNNSCPSGWVDRPKGVSSTKPGYDICRPGTGAKKAFVKKSFTDSCPEGYLASGNSYCVEGKIDVVAPTSGPVKKANPLDRCPVAYFTDPGNAALCTTKAANPPSIRLKGAGQCNPGELDDWGLYCVSNYENLLVKDAPEGTADYNNIYKNSYRAVGKTSRPNQEALPEGVSYTPAYLEIFGRVKRDGSPIGGGASASANSGAAASNPVAAAAAKQCAPKPKKKKGLGGFGKALGSAIGVDIPDGDDGC